MHGIEGLYKECPDCRGWGWNFTKSNHPVWVMETKEKKDV
jgi:hypothetical protein